MLLRSNPNTLNQKATMFDLSPFDETLFLDLDTVVLGRLDFGFQKAQQFGLAIAICESLGQKDTAMCFRVIKLSTTQGLCSLIKRLSLFLKLGES